MKTQGIGLPLKSAESVTYSSLKESAVAFLPRPRVRFAPTASGYFHVGNFRSLIATRQLADDLYGDLIIRLDDNTNAFLSLGTTLPHLGTAIKATGIRYEGMYLWSECVMDALLWLHAHLTPREILSMVSCKAYGTYPTWDKVLSCGIDGLTGITHALRGEDLRSEAGAEQFIHNCAPRIIPPKNKWVPLVTVNGTPISKSLMSFGDEPETGVLRAIKEYGVEALTHALRESLEAGVNEWDEIKRRWLLT